MTNGPGQTVAGVMGNVLEWYDFTLFGAFADVIARAFFPPPDAPVAGGGSLDYDGLVKAFAVNSGAFVVRPLGGVLIGYVGDKYGRKRALVLSLYLMVVPTFAMGCLPTYEQVGGLSTLLLTLCRLLQGVSVGGQLPACLIYTVETRPKERWGLYGSFVSLAGTIGVLLGNIVSAFLRSVLTKNQLVEWGWRIPFLNGILIAGVAAYLRIHGEEHNPNAGVYDYGAKDNAGERAGPRKPLRPRHPLRESFRRENLPALLSAFLTPTLQGASFYITFVWMAIFMDEMVSPPIENAYWINTMALFFGKCVPIPLVGHLSDVYGRRNLMVLGALGLGAFGPVAVLIISQGNAVRAFLAQLTMGWLLCLFGTPMSAWLMEKFPARVRMTSGALGYDLANATASAFAPLIATALVENVSLAAPGMIFPFFAAISLCGMFVSTEIHQDGGLEDVRAGENDGKNELDLKEEEEEGVEPKTNPIV